MLAWWPPLWRDSFFQLSISCQANAEGFDLTLLEKSSVHVEVEVFSFLNNPGTIVSSKSYFVKHSLLIFFEVFFLVTPVEEVLPCILLRYPCFSLLDDH